MVLRQDANISGWDSNFLTSQLNGWMDDVFTPKDLGCIPEGSLLRHHDG